MTAHEQVLRLMRKHKFLAAASIFSQTDHLGYIYDLGHLLPIWRHFNGKPR